MQIYYIYTISLGVLQHLGVIQKSSKCTVNTSDPTYILVSRSTVNYTFTSPGETQDSSINPYYLALTKSDFVETLKEFKTQFLLSISLEYD